MAVAKANNLDIEVVNVDLEASTEEYKKINPLAKVPTSVGADGYTLQECIAIAIYGTLLTISVGRQAKTALLPRTMKHAHTLRQISHQLSGDVLAHNSFHFPPST